MPLPKERLVFVGILGIALGALAVDRLVLGMGGPSVAGAAESAVPEPAAETAASPPVLRPAQPLPTESSLTHVAGRLRALDVSTSRLSELPESFRVPQKREPEASAPKPVEIDVHAPDVTAILVGPYPAAVADGRTVRVGDLVADWTVVAIASDLVVFDRQGYRVERRVR